MKRKRGVFTEAEPDPDPDPDPHLEESIIASFAYTKESMKKEGIRRESGVEPI